MSEETACWQIPAKVRVGDEIEGTEVLLTESLDGRLIHRFVTYRARVLAVRGPQSVEVEVFAAEHYDEEQPACQ